MVWIKPSEVRSVCLFEVKGVDFAIKDCNIANVFFRFYKHSPHFQENTHICIFQVLLIILFCIRSQDFSSIGLLSNLLAKATLAMIYLKSVPLQFEWTWDFHYFCIPNLKSLARHALQSSNNSWSSECKDYNPNHGSGYPTFGGHWLRVGPTFWS